MVKDMRIDLVTKGAVLPENKALKRVLGISNGKEQKTSKTCLSIVDPEHCVID